MKLTVLLDKLIPLPLRNELRLALGRYPKPLRERYPALAAIGLSRKAVVFDVGAHSGNFAETVLAYRPHAHLYAFEPIPDVYATLSARMNRYRNVVVENVALGREAGSAELKVRGFGEASSFLDNGEVLDQGVYGLDFSTISTISVPIVSVDAYTIARGLKKIDLLKLDVQGFELEVLGGAERMLQAIDWIYTEAQFQELYRGGPRYDEVFEYLQRRGFKLLQMTAFRADDAGRLMEADMLFRRVAP